MNCLNGVQNLIPYLTQTAIGIREKLSVFGDDYDTPVLVSVTLSMLLAKETHVIAIRRILEKTQKEKVEVFNRYRTWCFCIELINGFEKATGVKLNYQIVGRRAATLKSLGIRVSLIRNWVGS